MDLSNAVKVALIKSNDYVQGTRTLLSHPNVQSRLKSVDKVVIKINLVHMPPNIDVPLAALASL